MLSNKLHVHAYVCDNWVTTIISFVHVLHVYTLNINNYITNAIFPNGVTGYWGYIVQLMFSA